MTKDLLEWQHLSVRKFFISLVDGLHGLNVGEDFKCLCPRVEFFITHAEQPPF